MKFNLDNPDHYDRMVALLVKYNSYFRRQAEYGSCFSAEEKAREIIDHCIFGALEHGDCATGCCMALKTPSGKIRLFLEPLFP